MTIDASLVTPSTAKAFKRPRKKGCPYSLAQYLVESCEEKEANYAAELDESKHPRADDGKFGSGSGSGKKSKSKKDSGPEVKARFNPRTHINKAAKRGGDISGVDEHPEGGHVTKIGGETIHTKNSTSPKEAAGMAAAEFNRRHEVLKAAIKQAKANDKEKAKKDRLAAKEAKVKEREAKKKATERAKAQKESAKAEKERKANDPLRIFARTLLKKLGGKVGDLTVKTLEI